MVMPWLEVKFVLVLFSSPMPSPFESTPMTLVMVVAC
jgi:hypothetical protein